MGQSHSPHNINIQEGEYEEEDDEAVELIQDLDGDREAGEVNKVE